MEIPLARCTPLGILWLHFELVVNQKIIKHRFTSFGTAGNQEKTRYSFCDIIIHGEGQTSDVALELPNDTASRHGAQGSANQLRNGAAS